MKHKRRSYHMFWIISFAFLLLLTSHVFAATSEMKTISVVMDDNYPPYSFRDSQGDLQGITLDQWKLFERKTGIKVVITGMTWNIAYESMLQGKFDVIDTISHNEDRAKIFDYSKPYATIEVPIFFHKSISAITDVNSLEGFTMAAKKGDNSINVLKEYGITQIEEYDTAEAVVKAAKDHKQMIFVLGKSPAQYYLYKMGFDKEFNYTSSSLYTSQFFRAVKKGDTGLLTMVNDGFAKISERDYQAIELKWFGSTNVPIQETLFFRVILIMGATVFLVALLLFVWNRTLRRMVNKKTSELSSALTARKRVEAEIRTLNAVLVQQNTLARESQKVARLGSYVTNLDTREWECSPELHDIFGIDETYPHTLEGWAGIVHPDCQAELANYLLIVESTQQRFDYEYRILRVHDGEERWVHELGKIELDHNVNAVRLIGMIQDVTERKRAEEKIVYLSFRDQLTGLYNRRFFEKELARLDCERNYPLTLVMGDVNGLKLINDSFGHATGDELLTKVAQVLREACREDDLIARLGGDEFVIVLPNTDTADAEQILKRINALALQVRVGSIELSISFGYETKRYKEEQIRELFKRAEDHMYKKKLFEGPSMRGKTIKTIIRTLHEKNKREEQHSYRVSALCQSMGEALGLREGEVQELKTVGLLHDIGKITIDENILNKPGKLTKDEWEEIKRHPEIGYRILSTVNGMSEMAEYVLTHHERWDGLGYPKGLKSDELPLQTKIIAIADAYDAMTSARSYREALSDEVAIAELQKNSGTQFDPDLVTLFIEKVITKSS